MRSGGGHAHQSVRSNKTTAANVEMIKVKGLNVEIVSRPRAMSPSSVPAAMAGSSAKVNQTSALLMSP